MNNKMYLLYFFVSCFASFVVFAQSADKPGELKFAAIFVRHGARTPILSIKNLDKFTDWPVGLNELTASGERQHFILGQMFRQYYIEQEKFLSKTYNESELLVFSTDYRRTIMSGNSLTYGLYPDHLNKLNQAQIHDKSIWTPPFPLTISKSIIDELGNSSLPFDTPIIPITGINITYDKMINFYSCLKYSRKWDEYFLSKNFSILCNKHKAMLEQIYEMFDLNSTEFQGIKMLYLIDYIAVSIFEGFLKEFPIIEGIIGEIEEFFAEMLHDSLVVDPWMMSLAFNTLSKEIPEFMQNKIKGNDTSPKMILYQTHDSILIPYLAGFQHDTHLTTKIPFSSYLSLELRKREGKGNSESSYYVNVTFNGQIVKIQEFNEFKQFVESKGKLEKSWEEECRLETQSSQGVERNILIASSVSALILIAIWFIKRLK